MKRYPDFIVIGAMKCATSTLHTQLAAQPGIFMSTPKEPNFFSNDEIYTKGADWYQSLFDAAEPQDICGESSTHYTKLPTYPETAPRMRAHVPDAKLIYVIRHPIERLISQYIHEWTMGFTKDSIHDALDSLPILIEYSKYAMQLEPFLDTYGAEKILVVAHKRLQGAPQDELERIGEFIGYGERPTWRDDLGEENVSSQRMRKSRLRDIVVYAPVLSTIRRRLIPRSVRDAVKTLWTLEQRPELTEAERTRLTEVFDADLAKLGSWLGVELTCANFDAVAAAAPLEWAAPGESSS